jgi:arabinose-5-phosphate isomerase
MARPAHEIGLDVVRRERDALAALIARWTEVAPAFDQAVEAILACTGRVVVCGMGKSGQIGRKIASTLVSTGTPASFLHPAEGFHGDVGIVTARDIVLAISNSGSTREVMELVPVIRSLGARVIALTGPVQSPLVRAADIALCWGTFEEADPTGLVPTVSAAATLALGDALTVAVMEKRGFGASDYRLFHPSGAIGTKLTVRVLDLLRGAATNPCVVDGATFGETLEVITRSTLGGVNVVDGAGRLVGLVTDGDVRRTIQDAADDVGGLLARPIAGIMTRTPVTVTPPTFALDALRLMESHKPRPIYLLPVVDDGGRPVGLIHLHTFVQAGLGHAPDDR